MSRLVRPVVFVLVLLLIASFLMPLLAQPAFADTGHEDGFVAQLNSERAAGGLPALSVASDLTSAARAHSRVMADSDNLHHNPNLATSVSGWGKLGENVGVGPSVGSIHRALMDSSGHRANIMSSDYTEVGIGVVVADGRIWVTQKFRLPSGQLDPQPDTAAPQPERNRDSDSSVAGRADSGDAAQQRQQEEERERERWAAERRAEAQRALTELGWYSGPGEGEATDEYITAVREFQAAHGLQVDGVVGPETLGVLGDGAMRRSDYRERQAKKLLERDRLEIAKRDAKYRFRMRAERQLAGPTPPIWLLAILA